MILTDDMLKEAFDFREAELWNWLEDVDLFAFRLSDGEIGYCSVLGYNEEHYALTFYRGRKGFTSYYKALEYNDFNYAYQSFINMYELDYLSCDYMQAADLEEHTKRRIRSYAKKNGRTISRHKGWPDFTSYKPGKVLFGMDNEQDASDITEALHAANWLACKLETTDREILGFSDDAEYPDDEGGIMVPFLEPDGRGGYTLGTTAIPARMPVTYVAPVFENAILAHQVRGLPLEEEWMLKLVHLTAKNTSDDGKNSFFVTMLLGFSRNSDIPFNITSECCWIEQPDEILNGVARHLIAKGYRPSCIFVSDDHTYHLLKDFCDKCCITLDKVKRIEELDNLANFMFENLA